MARAVEGYHGVTYEGTFRNNQADGYCKDELILSSQSNLF